MLQTILLAKPRGFCAGVARAIDIVEQALAVYGAPMYVKHAIVHNIHVVKGLEKKGAIFVEEVDEIPEGARAIFSAHGSPPQHLEQAKKRYIEVIDAACPLVGKVHLEAKSFVNQGYTIVYVGHRGHLEGIGVKGEVDALGGTFYLIDNKAEAEALSLNDPKIALLSQTTLSLSDTQEIIAILDKKFPNAKKPPRQDICYATENRQSAVKLLAQQADVIFVIGSKTSSNSNRLKEVAQNAGATAYLIDDTNDIHDAWLSKVKVVGITAGASAPEYLIDEAIEYFQALGAFEVKEIEATTENIFFPLPTQLQNVTQ